MFFKNLKKILGISHWGDARLFPSFFEKKFLTKFLKVKMGFFNAMASRIWAAIIKKIQSSFLPKTRGVAGSPKFWREKKFFFFNFFKNVEGSPMNIFG